VYTQGKRVHQEFATSESRTILLTNSMPDAIVYIVCPPPLEEFDDQAI
jgi:hypothetical protein